MTGVFRQLLGRTADGAGGPFRFRVSDAVDVPLHGHLLRLKLLEGEPALGALEPGSRVRVRSPDDDARGGRVVEVQGFSATGGRPTQERLERKRELDIIISDEDAAGDGEPVRIGWLVEGPVGG